ncbi:lipoprotein [Erwinia sp. E_sp_B01_9]
MKRVIIIAAAVSVLTGCQLEEPPLK